jgi:hypothetical protein
VQTQQQQFERDLRAVFDAGGGCMTLTILTEASSVALVADVMAGDTAAKTVLHAADRMLRQIYRRTRRNALPCMLCDDGVLWRGEPPSTIGMLVPFGVAPVRTAVGLAFCSDCACRTQTELAYAAVAKFRDGMMPDLRVLPTMAEAGHA